MKNVRYSKASVIHNNAALIIRQVLTKYLGKTGRIQPLFERLAATATEDDLYFAVLVIAYGHWTEQWQIQITRDSFSTFKSLAESERENIEQYINELQNSTKQARRIAPGIEMLDAKDALNNSNN